MATDDDTRRLLEEIRDVQREHLAEYRRVTQQSLDLQKQAVSRQEQLGSMYRRVVMIGGLVVVALLVLLLFLLVRWAPRLFG
jgi:ferric-dicitrate binding protein FerR (iron transport regulator)